MCPVRALSLYEDILYTTPSSLASPAFSLHITAGIKKILQERKLWDDSLKLKCDGEDLERHRCCAGHLLANQPDFKQQKTAIQQLVESKGIPLSFIRSFIVSVTGSNGTGVQQNEQQEGNAITPSHHSRTT
ncbi:hypothetical protein [Absidia glauca]|uniref:Uncharacterized protein n=1 Tax=Absidia glauca TaxID=4829 RepID=A0A163K3Z1_ABSGL|nr:hypothetical protein [Absidia glauca]